MGLASAVPGVVTPKLGGLLSQGKITEEQSSMISTGMALENVIGFVLFVILYTIIGATSGTGSLVDMA